MMTLEVPKPTQSLDLNLFSPQTQTPTQTRSPEQIPSAQRVMPVTGPNVVVEPSYGLEEELSKEFKKQNFETVTRMYLQYSRNEILTCPMRARLLKLITEHPFIESGEANEMITVGSVMSRILIAACDNESKMTNF